MNACDIVQLEDDKGTKRMKTNAVMTRECHLYTTHPISQHGIIDELILSLELHDEELLGNLDQIFCVRYTFIYIKCLHYLSLLPICINCLHYLSLHYLSPFNVACIYIATSGRSSLA